MGRNRRAKSELNTTTVKQVQGPQKLIGPPNIGLVEIDATLNQKYLGTSFIGLDSSLQVLDNNSPNSLKSKYGYQLFRQMQEDSEVDASLDTLVQGSSSQPIEIVSELDPDDAGYKRSKYYADFISWMLEQFDFNSWEKQQLKSMFAYGNSVSEKDYDIKPVGRAERLVITDLRLQLPENYGFIADGYGEVYGVAPLNQPFIMPMGNLIPLSPTNLATNLRGAVPLHKLCIWSWDKVGNDPRGQSILIPAYIPWWSKQRAIEEWSCWLGRYSQPSLWGTPGPDAVAQCAPGTNQLIPPTELLLNELRKFKAGSAFALPFGSQLNLLQVAGGAEPFLASIDHFDIAINRAITGQHLATGEGQSQSRSAADVHAIVLKQYINSIRHFIARQINRDIIRPIIKANFGNVGELMPVVNLGDGDIYPPSLTEVAVLLQSGYFTEDQLIALDKKYGFPVRRTNNPAGPQAISANAKKDVDETDKIPIQTRQSRASQSP
jgi:hypothetical protein